MESQFKRLAGHTSIYGLASVLNASLGFILTPLYARNLGPTDFGTVTLFTITATFAATLFQIGTGSAIFRSIIQREIDKKIVLSTAFYFTLVLIVPLLGIFLLLSPSLSKLLFNTLPDRSLLLWLAFITAACDAVVTIPQAKLRIEERSILYSLLASGNFLLGVALNIYFVVGVHMGIRGIILANLLRAGTYCFVSILILIPDLRPIFSYTEVKELMRFGVPLIPISIAALILSVADRYFLQFYSSLTEVGIYSVGYKLGSVLQLPIGAFQIAWPTIMFAVYKTPQAKNFYSRLLTYFCLSLGFLSLFIAVFAREAIHLIATPEYSSAWQIVPFVALSQVALGILYATAVGINVKRRPEHILLAWFTGVSVHIVLNFILIPRYGMMGAALSTLVGYCIVAVVATMVSLRLYDIPYQYKRLFKLAIAITLVYSCNLLIPGEYFGVKSILKLMLLGAFPLILWAIGFFNQNEIALVKSTLHFPTRQPSTEPSAAKAGSSEKDPTHRS
jgi:O-antigen/teichoic acid export membrane protein